LGTFSASVANDMLEVLRQAGFEGKPLAVTLPTVVEELVHFCT
jgi:hypothetical protein